MADKSETQTTSNLEYNVTPTVVDNAVEGTSTIIDITKQRNLYVSSKTPLNIDRQGDYALRMIAGVNWDITKVMNEMPTDADYNGYGNQTFMAGGSRTVGQISEAPKGLWKFVHEKDQFDIDKFATGAKLDDEKTHLKSFIASEWTSKLDDNPGNVGADPYRSSSSYSRDSFVNWNGRLWKANRSTDWRPGTSMNTSGEQHWTNVGPAKSPEKAWKHLSAYGGDLARGSYGGYSDDLTVGGFHTTPRSRYGIEHTRENPIWKKFGMSGADTIDLLQPDGTKKRINVPYGTRWHRTTEVVTYDGNREHAEVWELAGMHSDRRWLPSPKFMTKFIFLKQKFMRARDGSVYMRPRLHYKYIPENYLLSPEFLEQIDRYTEVKKALKLIYTNSVYADTDQWPTLTTTWVNNDSNNDDPKQTLATYDLGVDYIEEYVSAHHTMSETRHGMDHPYHYWFGFVPLGSEEAEQKANRNSLFNDFGRMNPAGEKFQNYGRWTTIIEKFVYKEDNEKMCIPSGNYNFIELPEKPGVSVEDEVAFVAKNRRRHVEITWQADIPMRPGYSLKGGDMYTQIGQARYQSPYGYEKKSGYVNGSPKKGQFGSTFGTTVWAIVKAIGDVDIICTPPWTWDDCFGAPCIFCHECWRPPYGENPQGCI